MFCRSAICVLLVLMLFLLACGTDIPAIPTPTISPAATTEREIPVKATVDAAETMPLYQVTIEPAEISLAVNEELQINAMALDQTGNPIPGLTYVFQADERAGTIGGDGSFTAGSKAGDYPGAVAWTVSYSVQPQWS